MPPLVSILIPAFNAERWIGETLKSATAQTWRRLEVIVVDDGSTDATNGCARQFQSRQVQVVTQKNQGAAAARNHALSLAQGDYIQWLDADDLLATDKLERQIAAVEKGELSAYRMLSSAWGRFFYRSHKARFIPCALWADLPAGEWLLRQMEQNLFMHPAAWLVSRELTNKVGPWDTRLSYNDDGEYFGRVVLASDGVTFEPQAKAYYRTSGADSLSYLGNSGRKLESMLLSMELHIARVRALDHTERCRLACIKYLQDNLAHFYPGRMDLVARARELASTLNGELFEPTVSSKYVWIHRALGWKAAKRAQRFYNLRKTAFSSALDKTLQRLEHL